VGASTCLACAAGTYLATEGNTDESACVDCAAGKFSGSVGAGACVPCAAGKFSGAPAAATCASCPSGTYSETEASVCVDCAAGKFSGSVGAGACLEPTAIVVVTEETLEVLMKVELPYTKALFDADAQSRFLSAVANSVQTAVGNLYIKSVVEQTSSRRVFRKLLAVAVEVEFAIRVQDAAAQAAMIANDGLTETKLNTELSKQAFSVSACADGALPAATLRCAGASCTCAADCVCSAIQQELTTPVLHPTGATPRPGAHATCGTARTSGTVAYDYSSASGILYC
jgi:hypothetical protein